MFCAGLFDYVQAAVAFGFFEQFRLANLGKFGRRQRTIRNVRLGVLRGFVVCCPILFQQLGLPMRVITLRAERTLHPFDPELAKHGLVLMRVRRRDLFGLSGLGFARRLLHITC